MPNFDRTGPRGQGPMTGRGRGNCVNPYQRVNVPVNERNVGRGFGRGPGTPEGYGRGRRPRRYY